MTDHYENSEPDSTRPDNGWTAPRDDRHGPWREAAPGWPGGRSGPDPDGQHGWGPGAGQHAQPGYGHPGSGQQGPYGPGYGGQHGYGPRYGAQGQHAGWEHQPGPQQPWNAGWSAGAWGGQPGGTWQQGQWGPPPPRSRVRRRAGTALATAGVLAAAAIGVAVGQLTANAPGHSSATAPPAGSGASGGSGGLGSGSGGLGTGFGSGTSGGSVSTASGGPSDPAAIASKVDGALVDINTNLSYQGQEAAGTGMVLTSSGQVLTNNHVIEGATSISVTDLGNGRTYAAKVVGYDRSRDIAVLQLSGAHGLKTISLGNSSHARVGQAVVGVGNAGGAGGTPSAAGGAITALGQSITASDSGSGTTEQLHGLIETNAGIQPGDSGGPLITTSGRVIGMDTAASASSPGLNTQAATGSQGFAIPINTALSVAHQILDQRASSTVHIGPTAFLGVEIQAPPNSSQGSNGSGGFGGYFGTPSGSGAPSGGTSTNGAVVAGVLNGTPAASSNLVQGDVITSYNGKNVTSPNDLTGDVLASSPGQRVVLGYTDPATGQSGTVGITLTSGPPQ